MKLSNLTTMCVLSPHSLLSSDRFLSSIKLFLELMPDLMPEKWGWAEPKRAFDASRLEDLIPSLTELEKVRNTLPPERRQNFLINEGRPEAISWTKDTFPKAVGSFSPRWGHGERATHSSVYADTEMDAIDQQKRIKFLKEYSVNLNCDLGYIDVLTPYYKEYAFRNGASQFLDHIYFVTHILRHWLPDIFWGTVFGGPYVELFGKSNLLNAPVAVAEEIAENMIYVQLTDKLSDAVNHPEELNKVRKMFKESLVVDAFYRENCGVDCHDIIELGTHGDIYVTPKFELTA